MLYHDGANLKRRIETAHLALATAIMDVQNLKKD
jgi:hypothetical protein